MIKTSTYHRPRTLEEAWRLKEEDDSARFIAGGTDLMVGSPPAAMISLRRVPGLDGIAMGEQVRIGALATVADLLADAEIVTNYPALTESCRLFASMQIRNAATVGGNLCNASPAADLAPPLLVLDARVEVAGPGGTREIPLDELLLGPGCTALAPAEILTHVVFDRPAPGSRAAFLRRSRVRMDIALVSVAMRLDLEGDRCRNARVAAGAAGPTPLRLRDVEALLTGPSLTPEIARQAAEIAERSVSPIDDIRTTAAYRRRMVAVYTGRAISRLMDWSDT